MRSSYASVEVRPDIDNVSITVNLTIFLKKAHLFGLDHKIIFDPLIKLEGTHGKKLAGNLKYSIYL